MVEALREADAWGSRALRADEEEAVIVTYILPATGQLLRFSSSSLLLILSRF